MPGTPEPFPCFRRCSSSRCEAQTMRRLAGHRPGGTCASRAACATHPARHCRAGTIPLPVRLVWVCPGLQQRSQTALMSTSCCLHHGGTSKPGSLLRVCSGRQQHTKAGFMSTISCNHERDTPETIGLPWVCSRLQQHAKAFVVPAKRSHRGWASAPRPQGLRWIRPGLEQVADKDRIHRRVHRTPSDNHGSSRAARNSCSNRAASMQEPWHQAGCSSSRPS